MFNKLFKNPSLKNKKQSFFSLQPQHSKKRNAQTTADIFNCLQAKMVNNCNLPDSFLENDYYRDVISFARANAEKLKDYSSLGRVEFNTIRCSSFKLFKKNMKEKIDSIRKYYIETTGKPHPFIVVAHDVWENLRKDINGLTIFFTDPRGLWKLSGLLLL